MEELLQDSVTELADLPRGVQIQIRAGIMVSFGTVGEWADGNPWPRRFLRSVEVFVFGEEVVEDPEGGLEVEVDDVLGSGLRLRQPRVLHEVKGQADVRRLLVKGLQQYSNIEFTNGTQIFWKDSLATKQTLRCIFCRFFFRKIGKHF